MDLVLVFVGLVLMVIVGGVVAVPIVLSRRKRTQCAAPPQGWGYPQQYGHQPWGSSHLPRPLTVGTDDLVKHLFAHVDPVGADAPGMLRSC